MLEARNKRSDAERSSPRSSNRSDWQCTHAPKTMKPEVRAPRRKMTTDSSLRADGKHPFTSSPRSALDRAASAAVPLTRPPWPSPSTSSHKFDLCPRAAAADDSGLVAEDGERRQRRPCVCVRAGARPCLRSAASFLLSYQISGDRPPSLSPAPPPPPSGEWPRNVRAPNKKPPPALLSSLLFFLIPSLFLLRSFTARKRCVGRRKKRPRVPL